MHAKEPISGGRAGKAPSKSSEWFRQKMLPAYD